MMTRMIRGLFHTLLMRKGHHVHTADDGQKGIDVFRRERPHVTILDFEMPEMDRRRCSGKSARLIRRPPSSC